MKNYIKLSVVALSVAALSSCSSDFGDVNVNPESLNESSVPMTMVFSNAQHQVLGSDWDAWRNGCIYLSQINQHVNAGGWWWSYPLNSFSDGYASSYWDAVFGSGSRGSVYQLKLCLDTWADDPAHTDDYQIARVVRVYVFNRLTDLHGDIPYSQASQPALYPYPSYDSQESIYKDMLNELDQAASAMSNGTAAMGSQDLWYGGDMTKWKKFTYSLMLRLGMRLVKVDEATAKTYVAKAVAGGVITSNDDTAYLSHTGGSVDDDSSEPYGKIYAHCDAGVGFISKRFMDLLQSTNDPRVGLIGGIVAGNASNDAKDAAVNKSYTNAGYERGVNTPSLQQGLPGPASMSSGSGWFAGQVDTRFGVTDDAEADLDKYKGRQYTVNVNSDAKFYKKHFSIVNRYTYSDPEAPTFIVTAAETNLLLAEAVVRGYISGNAETYYNNGVKAAITQFQLFPNLASDQKDMCTEAAANAYLAANPYQAANAMEQINTQYWITTFCDEYESFANWRRTDLPKIEFNSLPLPADKIDALGNAYTADVIRRFPYSNSESSSNYDNWSAAKAKMGSVENEFDGTRVWWDVKK